ncbi:MAG TPA: hypothetical protein VI110_06615 [Lapillicoccus sp.]
MAKPAKRTLPKADPSIVPILNNPAGRPVEYAVLCGPEDAAAVWAAHELTRRGLPVRVVTIEELVYSASLTHRLSADGSTVAVRLADGSILGPGLCGTLNRIVRLPRAHLAATDEKDRDYVLSELHAVLTSLLFALPGVVVGRADPRGLSGAWWRPAEWLVAAGRSGLISVGYRSGGCDEISGRQTVLVVGAAVLTPSGVDIPTDVVVGCQRLAERHGGGLLGLDFAVEGSTWAFERATPWPDLRPGGALLADALHATLLSREPVPA